MNSMEYMVVTGNRVAQVSQDVNHHIAHGWEPLGGLCAVNGGPAWYGQAMIRKIQVEVTK